MTDPVDLDAKRKAKAPRCQICGNPVHDFIGQCPRVVGITQEIDGAETYSLIPWDEYVAGADPV
jgi:hypothetical protein